jgi:hypothetical protein
MTMYLVLPACTSRPISLPPQAKREVRATVHAFKKVMKFRNLVAVSDEFIVVGVCARRTLDSEKNYNYFYVLIKLLLAPVALRV